MASPLEGAIRRTIGKAMASTFYAATVLRSGGFTGPEYDPTPLPDVEYPCRGIVDTYSAYYLASGLIQAGDMKVILLAESLAIDPKPGDKVTIRGKTYSVINAASDPALAAWTLQARA